MALDDEPRLPEFPPVESPVGFMVAALIVLLLGAMLCGGFSPIETREEPPAAKNEP
jgi:hypothetical protein